MAICSSPIRAGTCSIQKKAPSLSKKLPVQGGGPISLLMNGWQQNTALISWEHVQCISLPLLQAPGNYLMSVFINKGSWALISGDGNVTTAKARVSCSCVDTAPRHLNLTKQVWYPAAGRTHGWTTKHLEIFTDIFTPKGCDGHQIPVMWTKTCSHSHSRFSSVQAVKRRIYWRTNSDEVHMETQCRSSARALRQMGLFEEIRFDVRLFSFARVGDEFCTTELGCPMWLWLCLFWKLAVVEGIYEPAIFLLYGTSFVHIP